MITTDSQDKNMELGECVLLTMVSLSEKVQTVSKKHQYDPQCTQTNVWRKANFKQLPKCIYTTYNFELCTP